MSKGRIILVAGLPAGLGASTVALALADAWCGVGRDVVLVSSLGTMGPALPTGRPVRRDGPACLLTQEQGPTLAPLELCDEAALPAFLPVLARDADVVLVDRFTGLHVKDNPWFRAAGEILLLVDGRAGMDSRSLMLAGHVLRHWPDRTLHLLHNRMEGPGNWQTSAAGFQRRLERHYGIQAPELGCLPAAAEIARSTREGRPFTRMYPNHPASRCLRQAARQLMRSPEAGVHPAREAAVAGHAVAEASKATDWIPT
ncbi:MAG: hypothetical protein Q8O14_05800 [bacterium]|jgi:MinD-like ATPase involved in chromosome partitioning or flagellar assembly|nr:hypothetical protein [bacterium]